MIVITVPEIFIKGSPEEFQIIRTILGNADTTELEADEVDLLNTLLEGIKHQLSNLQSPA